MGLDYDEIMALASKVDEEQSMYVDEVNEVKKEMEHSGLQTWRVLLRRRRGFVRGILREIFWTATQSKIFSRQSCSLAPAIRRHVWLL